MPFAAFVQPPPVPVPTPAPVPEATTDGSPTTPGTLLDAPTAPTGGVVTLTPGQAIGAPPTLSRPETVPVDDTLSFPADQKNRVYIEAGKSFRSAPGNPDLFIAEGDVVIR
ncbi:MAG: hypothetical protein H7Y38_01795, partial [Armatimonadetes bacterium]|nr:hypothetical protein [Armatimonadota bacterium]